MITIDTESTEPLFSQLVSEIKKAVQTHQIQPNDSLPSIRQLAGDLDINAKTVAKAYKLLERDGVIVSRGYRGTFVHADALANSEVELLEWLADTLAKDIEKYRNAGATDSEIRNVISRLLA